MTPIVINTFQYELGALAKESSVLSALSGGRFEMAVGAGDWPHSYLGWGRPLQGRAERVARLAETVDVLRRL